MKTLELEASEILMEIFSDEDTPESLSYVLLEDFFPSF